MPPRRGAFPAANYARHRALFANFFRRELFSRYLGSVSGLAWALLHPLALLAVYHFVFTTIFRTGAMNGKSFLIFVAVALWPWLAAQEALEMHGLAEQCQHDQHAEVATSCRVSVAATDA